MNSMTSTNENQFFGIPNPITELTIEQDLKMRQIKDALDRPSSSKEDIITVFLALQKQNFVLSNSLMNLVSQWHLHHPLQDQVTTEEEVFKPGIL